MTKKKAPVDYDSKALLKLSKATAKERGARMRKVARKLAKKMKDGKEQ